jgi:replicative DNA helicase
MSPQSTLFNTQGVIIGACLIETNAFHRINGILKPDYFTPNYAKIFMAMQALNEANKPIDIVTVCAYLSIGKTLDFNKQTFLNLASITNMVCSTANLVHHSLWLIEQYWQAKALQAIPNTKTIINLELAQTLDDLKAEINSPDYDILDSLTMIVENIQLCYPKDYHVYKNLIEVKRQMQLDVSQIEEILLERGELKPKQSINNLN